MTDDTKPAEEPEADERAHGIALAREIGTAMGEAAAAILERTGHGNDRVGWSAYATAITALINGAARGFPPFRLSILEFLAMEEAASQVREAVAEEVAAHLAGQTQSDDGAVATIPVIDKSKLN